LTALIDIETESFVIDFLRLELVADPPKVSTKFTLQVVSDPCEPRSIDKVSKLVWIVLVIVQEPRTIYGPYVRVPGGPDSTIFHATAFEIGEHVWSPVVERTCRTGVLQKDRFGAGGSWIAETLRKI